MFITVLPHDVFEQAQIGDLSDCRSENALPAITDTACYSLVALRKLLLRAGDQESLLVGSLTAHRILELNTGS